MNSNSIQAGAKVFQPVQCISAGGYDGIDVISLPWSEVVGAQVIVNVIDNFAVLASGLTQDARYWGMLEVSIWGAVQGYASCLKRQQVRMISGPMFYRFDSDEFYSHVSVRARNMSGGKSGGDQSGATPPSAAGGFSLACQVMLVAPHGIARGF